MTERGISSQRFKWNPRTNAPVDVHGHTLTPRRSHSLRVRAALVRDAQPGETAGELARTLIHLLPRLTAHNAKPSVAKTVGIIVARLKAPGADVG